MKKLVFWLSLAVLMTVPVSVSAVTVEELQAQIETLTVQINRLKNAQTVTETRAEIRAIPKTISSQPGDTPPSGEISSCLNLQNDLFYRSTDAQTGGEVSLLQDFLQTNGYLNSEPTGFFGRLTLQAVKDFQKTKNLNPTGYAGPLTRGKIKDATCGGEAVTPDNSGLPAIKITSPFGDQVIQRGKDKYVVISWQSTNAWKNAVVLLQAVSLNFSGLTYPMANKPFTTNGLYEWDLNIVKDSAERIPLYGQYRIRVILDKNFEYSNQQVVADGPVITIIAEGGVSTPIPPPPVPSPIYAPRLEISPSATTVSAGEYVTISWKASDASYCKIDGDKAIGGVKFSVSGSQAVGPISAGNLNQYTVTCVGFGGSTSKSVTINVSGVAIYPISAKLFISTAASNELPMPTKDGVAVYLDLPKKYDGKYVVFTLNPVSPSVPVSNGTIGVHSQTYYVNELNGGHYQLWLDLTRIHEGVASNPGGVHWFSVPSGKYKVTAVVYLYSPFKPGTDYEYLVGPQLPAFLEIINSSDFDLITTTVSAPTLTLTADPPTVTAGKSTTISWSSTNTTSCWANERWGAVGDTGALNGSATITYAIEASGVKTYSYSMTCSGPGGSVTRWVKVQVNQTTPPTVTVTYPNVEGSYWTNANARVEWTTTNWESDKQVKIRIVCATSCGTFNTKDIATVPNTGSHIFTVPNNIPTNASYYFEVSTVVTQGEAAYDRSDYRLWIYGSTTFSGGTSSITNEQLNSMANVLSGLQQALEAMRNR